MQNTAPSNPTPSHLTLSSSTSPTCKSFWLMQNEIIARQKYSLCYYERRGLARGLLVVVGELEGAVI